MILFKQFLLQFGVAWFGFLPYPPQQLQAYNLPAYDVENTNCTN